MLAFISELECLLRPICFIYQFA